MNSDSEQSADEELIHRLNAGDASAFEPLYLRYRDWVVRLAFRFAGHEDDAMDVLQETFKYVLSKFPGFELRAAMTTFLYPTVRNLAHAARRKRQRSLGTAQSTDGEEIDVENLCAATGRAEDQSEFTQLLASLSPAHREIVLMRIIDDMSLRSIAQALSISEGTAKSRWHYAIQALKDSPAIQRLIDGE